MQIPKMMHFKRHLRLLLSLLPLLCLLQFNVQAQTDLADFLEAAKEFEDNKEAFEQPDAVGDDLGPDALRFFFLSAKPVKRNYYYQEGGEYRTIQAAYNTFGNIHRISARSKLELCEKITQMVNDEEVVTYVPIFQMIVANRTNLFAIFLPSVEPADGKVIGLNAIDFSEEMFPYNQLTFMNILPKPVMVMLEDQRTILKPGQIMRSGYSIRRKGVGYLKVALAVRDVDGGAKLLYNQRIAVYEDERTIAIPIADPWGAPEIEVLTYRDSGVGPR